MPPHGKPEDPFAFRKAHEIHALDAHFDLRNVPPRTTDRLLLACWNIANFGAQNRSDNALDVPGDMNVPDMTLKQASYRALIEYGMQPLK